jgi:copper chaperone CopZ
MKKRLLAGAMILALSLALSLCGAAAAATRIVVIKVKGMTCGSCAIAIEQTLKATEGVEGAEVSYESGEARVKYDDRKVSPAKLREIINDMGYEAEGGRANRRRAKPKAATCGDASCCATR